MQIAKLGNNQQEVQLTLEQVWVVGLDLVELGVTLLSFRLIFLKTRRLNMFLQKRLGKGQKFFDSGDYQMAKQVFLEFFLSDPGVWGPIYVS